MCSRIDKQIYYIHTEKYSPKSYVVNFGTQISSSQSEERTMVFTREKKWYVQSESRTMFFPVWEKWYVQSKATEVCEFRAKIPLLLLQFAAPLRTHSTRKVLLRVFLAKKVKNISEMECNSFVCFTVESRRNNSGKGKTEWDVSFCCAFCRSYFAFHLSLSLYWNRPFYLNSLIFNCALRTNS